MGSPDQNKIKLSVALSVRNEEANIERCLLAIKDIADEIIIVDEYSTDKTVEIAKRLGAKVYQEPHHDNFHITKQKAIDLCIGDWILQLDADEVITPELGNEIQSVINLPNEEIKGRKISSSKQKLFERHIKVVEKRDGALSKNTGEIVAFFIPRRNMFLGKPLIHAGVYPDPAIRLFKKGKAYLPAKSVHEIMQIEGDIAWLENDMLHYDSPTLKRYLDRANRYTSFTASQYNDNKMPRSIFKLLYFSFVKPVIAFITLFIRHKGYKDGMRGFIWSIFSALHFPLAYFKYWSGEYN